MERKYFTFYKSFAESLLKCDEKTQYEVIRAMIDYSFYDKEVKLNGVADALWVLIKPVLDANNKKFENGCKGGEFGKLGGRPKTPHKPQENPIQTPMVIKRKNNDKENENEEGDTSVDNLIEDNGEGRDDGVKPTPTLSNPTLEEVLEYAKKMQLDENDAKSFYFHYDSQGWETGNGTKLKKWWSKLQGWCMDKSFKRNNQAKGSKNINDEAWKNEMYAKLAEQDRRKQLNQQ